MQRDTLAQGNHC